MSYENRKFEGNEHPIPPNNSHRKETKTASEERKEPEMKPFHERYREERVERPKHRNSMDQDLNGSAASAYSNASSRRKPENPHIGREKRIKTFIRTETVSS